MNFDAVREKLSRSGGALARRRVLCGFDGFQDRIVRPIRKSGADRMEYFDTIGEFGRFLAGKEGKSCSVELDVRSVKIGGNLPIYSNALGTLGVAADCIGMFDGAESLFAAMSPNCRLYSYREAERSDCLEFRDGKVMLAGRCGYEGDPWPRIRQVLPDIRERAAAADLVSLLNWSELLYSQSLWESLYSDCLADVEPDFSKGVLFDLCDISRKDPEEIVQVLELLASYSQKRRTTLSLNENEALLLGRGVLEAGDHLEKAAEALRERFSLHEVVVHTLRASLLYTREGAFRLDTFFCPSPTISTGAGDHFNAGYSLGCLLELEPLERLLTANLTASRYIRTANSPACSDLVAHMAEVPE